MRHRLLPHLRGIAMLALVLGAAALLQWLITRGPIDEPWGVSEGGREWVEADFTRCGRGRGPACVVDGDTFHLGERTIRILGIDAPEVGDHARCPDEARRGEAATARLQALLSAGRFEMVARLGDETDQYGRELRTLRRTGADGRKSSIAAQLRAEGLVHRYDGHKTAWCA
jgi:endonuclease YncB( thermonuclease family)